MSTGPERPARPAVFLDRDGTVMVDRHYLGDPEGVALLPGAGAAIARLNRAGLPVVLITNQSGIGRGYFSTADFRAVQHRLEQLLAAEGAHLDAVYHCPHAPDQAPPCACRKPSAGLFHQAAAEQSLDLGRSAFVGDRLRDVLPALEVGGRAILLETLEAEPETGARPPGVELAASLAEAVERILAGRRFD